MVYGAPYIDVQINGFAGCDFNDVQSSLESWALVCERLKADGVQGFLAAIITDNLQVMTARLAHLVDVRRQLPLLQAMMWGIHIEGPFINSNPGYVGAHPAWQVKPADAESMQRLLDAAKGLTRIVTLAPECDPGFKVTRLLAQKGIVVAAGHCNPTFNQLREAIDAGVTMFTHLGNGCPMLLHRHDNVIQRVLSLAEHLWISFIADGVHIPYPALGNYLKCATLERCLVTTDAMAAAGLGPGCYRLGRCAVEVGDDMAAWAPDRSHLIGSAITMPQVAQRLHEQLGLSDAEIKLLAYDNPLAAIGGRRIPESKDAALGQSGEVQ